MYYILSVWRMITARKTFVQGTMDEWMSGGKMNRRESDQIKKDQVRTE